MRQVVSVSIITTRRCKHVKEGNGPTKRALAGKRLSWKPSARIENLTLWVTVTRDTDLVVGHADGKDVVVARKGENGTEADRWDLGRGG